RRVAVRGGEGALRGGLAALGVEDLVGECLDQVRAGGSDLGRGRGHRDRRGAGAAPGDEEYAECRAGAAGHAGCDAGEDLGHTEARRGPRAAFQMWTTGQVSVRVMPGTFWTRATTSLPSSSTLRASARTITSYGPVTSSACVTPLMAATSLATCAALPTSVWIRMYAWTTSDLPLL